MQVKTLKADFIGLGVIEVNTEIPNKISEYIGEVTRDYATEPCFYHATIKKTEEGNFSVKSLMVIKPIAVNVGWMENSKGNKNFITVIQNTTLIEKCTIYPNAVKSVVYL